MSPTFVATCGSLNFCKSTIRWVRANLAGRATFFENIIVNRIYGSKRLASNFGAWHTHAEGFLHAYHQFERVDRVEAEAIRAEERKVICDLIRSGLQHQIF